MHQKRKSIPKTWPIPRKGKKYIIVPRSPHKLEFNLSVLVILRDILHVAINASEARKIIKSGEIELNGKKLFDEKRGIGLFDIITIKKIKKSFMMVIEKGKLSLKEIQGKQQKISKVIDKKILNKGKVQINLMDGNNLITKEKINTNDTIVLDLEKNSIAKILPLKKDSEVFIIQGKWLGNFAKIQEIKKPLVEIKIDNKKVLIPIKNIIVIDQKW
jgi:small subunit ribosomal protein S4e